MIVFFSIDSIIVIVLLFVVLVLSIFNSAIQVYAILESHMFIVILLLIIRAAASVLSYVISSKKRNCDISKIRIIVEVVANLLFIVAFCLFIHDMAVLQPSHPVVTAICSFFSIYSIGYSLILSINFNDFFDVGEDYLSTILLLIISIMIIITTIISGIYLKIFVYILTSIISTLGYQIINDL